jgi:hypothetical protein
MKHKTIDTPKIVNIFILQEETYTELTALFILNSFISSKLFFLEVREGSSFIDPVLLQEET